MRSSECLQITSASNAKAYYNEVDQMNLVKTRHSYGILWWGGQVSMFVFK